MKRPSPGTAIAVLSLVVATSGTSIAASHYLITSGRQIKPGVVQLAALSVKARKALRGTRGRSGPAGPAGPAGAAGAPGPPGSARAYGYVAVGNVLEAARSKNIAVVAHPSVGSYCITPAGSAGIDPATTGLIATPDYSVDGSSATSQTIVEWASGEGGGSGCPVGAFEVHTFLETATASSLAVSAHDEPFFFVVP